MSGAETKLFFAILPPPGLQPVIESLSDGLQAAHRLRGHPIRSARLHVTLAAVFDPHRSLDDTIALAAHAAGGLYHPKFDVRFDRTQSFRNRDPHPFVLAGGGVALCDFQRLLADRLRRAGLALERSFTPHLTLLWADRCVGEYPVAPLCWTAREFVLVKSLIGQSRHVHLARWALE